MPFVCQSTEHPRNIRYETVERAEARPETRRSRKVGQFESGDSGAPRRALQLLPSPRITEDHASHGRRDHGPRLDD